MPYPIVAAKPLPSASKKWYEFDEHRSESDLPKLPLGGVYVFRLGDGRCVQPRGRVDLRDSAVTEAVEVYVVQTEPTDVVVDLAIPSSLPGQSSKVRVTFDCEVTDPAEVVRRKITDAGRRLSQYLGEDARLGSIGSDLRPERIKTLRERVQAKVMGRFEVTPPRIPGMRVGLGTVTAQEPPGVKKFAEDWAQVERENQIKILQERYADRSIQRIIAILSRGGLAQEALALARGEMTAAEAASRTHEEAAHRRELVASVVRDMISKPWFQGFAVDPVAAINFIIGGPATAGRGPAGAGSSSQLPPGPHEPPLYLRDDPFGEDEDDGPDFSRRDDDY